MKTLRIKLKNADGQFWDQTRADFVRGDTTIEVPDAPFWRRRITDGTFVLVEGEPTAGKRAIEASLEAEAETTKTGPIRSKGKRSKSKGDDAKADDAKGDETTSSDADANALEADIFTRTDGEG